MPVGLDPVGGKDAVGQRRLPAAAVRHERIADPLGPGAVARDRAVIGPDAGVAVLDLKVGAGRPSPSRYLRVFSRFRPRS